jgi:transcription-repair coupling factor (superfamily II helicase)
VRRLVTLGYGGGPLAETRGEFSVRGGIVDVFPVDAADPVRIELDDDRIDRMRPYDPETQRGFPSTAEGRRGIPFQRVRILPAREVILDPETIASSKEALRARLSEIGSNLEQRMAVLDDLERSIYHPGVEFLLPLLDPGAVPLARHLGPGALTLLVEPPAIRAEIEDSRRRSRGADRARGAGSTRNRPAGAPTRRRDLARPPDRVAALEIDRPDDVARKHEPAPGAGGRRPLRFEGTATCARSSRRSTRRSTRSTARPGHGRVAGRGRRSSSSRRRPARWSGSASC